MRPRLVEGDLVSVPLGEPEGFIHDSRVSWAVFRIMVRGTLGRNRVFFRKPVAQIDQAAALAAKRPIGIGGREFRGPLAGRAADGLGVQVQQVSVKGRSSRHCVARWLTPFQLTNRRLQR